MGKILIVHSNEQTATSFRDILEKDGHWVLVLNQPPEVPNRILSHRPDVVLMSDHALDGDPKEFISGLRKLSLGPPLPVVLLTRNENLDDVVKALDRTGSNGLLSDANPSPTEISNVVQNLLERPPGKKGKKRFLRYGHLELDNETRSVRLGVALVADLPKRLFDLLWLLTKRSIESKEISPRSLIISKIWKTRVRDREVDVVISRLKTRVPFLAPYIETVAGKGYRFTLPSLSSKQS